MSVIKVFAFMVLALPAFFSAYAGQLYRISPGADFQEFLQKAREGDTLFFEAGEHVVIRAFIQKPLYITGAEGAEITAQNEGPIFIVQAPNTTIEKLHLRNTGNAFLEDIAAVRYENTYGGTVRGLTITDTFFGIYLAKTDETTVENNYIRNENSNEINSGNGIHLWKSAKNIVRDNKLIGLRDGIYFEFVDSSKIINNYSEGNIRYGLHFMFSNDNLYESNIFKNNGAGVAVMFSSRIIMRKNTFSDNKGLSSYGILLKEINECEMVNNLFEQNTQGIHAEGANRIYIHHNDFIFNGKAIMMKGNCYGNNVTANNFMQNTFEVVTDSKQNENEYNGNYWSKYRGYDLDGDRYGDIPHRPVGLFALITLKIPAAGLLINSFFVNLLETAEQIFPQMTPDNLQDDQPRMKKVNHDRELKTQ